LIRPIACFALVAVASCAGDPPRISSAGLAGEWRSADGVALSCEDLGLLTLTPPGPKPKIIIGEYTFNGSVATFRYQPESKVCPDEIGQYAIELRGNTFTATLLRDHCTARVKMLTVTWTRTAAGRVTPGQ